MTDSNHLVVVAATDSMAEHQTADTKMIDEYEQDNKQREVASEGYPYTAGSQSTITNQQQEPEAGGASLVHNDGFVLTKDGAQVDDQSLQRGSASMLEPEQRAELSRQDEIDYNKSDDADFSDHGHELNLQSDEEEEKQNKDKKQDSFDEIDDYLAFDGEVVEKPIAKKNEFFLYEEDFDAVEVPREGSEVSKEIARKDSLTIKWASRVPSNELRNLYDQASESVSPVSIVSSKVPMYERVNSALSLLSTGAQNSQVNQLPLFVVGNLMTGLNELQQQYASARSLHAKPSAQTFQELDNEYHKTDQLVSSPIPPSPISNQDDCKKSQQEQGTHPEYTFSLDQERIDIFDFKASDQKLSESYYEKHLQPQQSQLPHEEVRQFLNSIYEEACGTNSQPETRQFLNDIYEEALFGTNALPLTVNRSPEEAETPLLRSFSRASVAHSDMTAVTDAGQLIDIKIGEEQFSGQVSTSNLTTLVQFIQQSEIDEDAQEETRRRADSCEMSQFELKQGQSFDFSRPSATPALGGGNFQDRELQEFLAKHAGFSAKHAHPDLGGGIMIDGLPGIMFKRRGSGISQHSAMTELLRKSKSKESVDLGALIRQHQKKLDKKVGGQKGTATKTKGSTIKRQSNARASVAFSSGGKKKKRGSVAFKADTKKV